MSGEVEIKCVVKVETAKALLIGHEGQDVWVPKAWITDQTGEGMDIENIFLKEHHAEQLGLS